MIIVLLRALGHRGFAPVQGMTEGDADDLTL